MRKEMRWFIGAVLFMSLLAGLDGSLSFSQDVQGLIRGIDEQQKKVQTLVAGFSQRKETSLAKDPLVSSGTVKFKRPDRVHFIYSQPEQMEVALEGKTI